jgi:hypothetical protein
MPLYAKDKAIIPIDATHLTKLSFDAHVNKAIKDEKASKCVRSCGLNQRFLSGEFSHSLQTMNTPKCSLNCGLASLDKLAGILQWLAIIVAMVG